MKLPMASGLEDDELGVEVDDGVVVLWRRLPVASAPPLDRIRVRTVGIVAATNLVSCAAVPTSSIYGTARQGATSHLLGWASPIRTQVKGPVGRWANWWRSIQYSVLCSS